MVVPHASEIHSRLRRTPGQPDITEFLEHHGAQLTFLSPSQCDGGGTGIAACAHHAPRASERVSAAGAQQQQNNNIALRILLYWQAIDRTFLHLTRRLFPGLKMDSDEYEEMVEQDGGLWPSNVNKLRDLLTEIRRMSCYLLEPMTCVVPRFM